MIHMTYTLGCMWGFGFFKTAKYFAVGEDQNKHVDDMKLFDDCCYHIS